MKVIRLAITDDHALIREGLIRIISYEKDLEIVIESDSGEDLIKKLDGVETLKIVKKRWPQIKIVILTVEKQKRKIKEVLKLGADGYVLKESAGGEITSAIRTVVDGGKYIDKSLMQTMFMEAMVGKKGSELDELSDRELSVLIMLSQGMKNKEIADNLYLSEKTVKNYVTSIFRKINVEDRVHAAIYALENNVAEYYENKKRD